MELAGKGALITGGGTGVGRATALALAARGCGVVVTYSRSQDEAEATVADIRQLGVAAEAVHSDAAVDAQCRDAVARTVEVLGRLDVLINNAATTKFIAHDQLDAVDEETWDRIFAVNVRGPFQCVRAARSDLERHGGEVVNISSIAGIAANGSSIPYAASKAALNNMTMSLARALAPKVRVNAVAPGLIDGRWVRRGVGDRYDDLKQRFEQATPLGRVCTPEDVAGAVLALITGPDMVTGQVLVCDGGYLLR